MPSLPGMKDGGYYDEHSARQRVAVDAMAPWIDHAVATMVLPEETRTFTVADYGCAEGANSIHAVGMAVDAFRRRRPVQPVCGIHSDLPSNNFNRLFLSLNDPLSSTYLQDRGRRRPNIFALCTGASFYEPVLPPGSVHFAMSFTSVHWLDRVPDRRRPAPGVFAEQAALDLATFYRHRAVELAPGGKLLIITPGTDASKRRSTGRRRMLLNDAAAPVIAAGLIDSDRWRRFVSPTYRRSLEQMAAPLRHAAGPGFGAFTVDRAERLDLPVPFAERFRQTGDVRAYAVEYVSFLRAITEPVLAQGVGASAAAMDALYKRAIERLEAEPELYPMNNVNVAILLTRT